MKVLLLGEGDFSFTFALAELLQSHAHEDTLHALLPNIEEPVEIIATSLDSKQEVLNKYPSFAFHSVPSNVKMFHSVNALDGSQIKRIASESPPDCILWNHPHLGTESCERHFQLLLHFFHEMNQVFPDTRVVVSLLADQIERWRTVDAATRSSFQLVKIFPLKESDFPGYTCRRNLGGDSFKSARTRSNWDPAGLQSYFLVFQPQSTPPLDQWIDVDKYLKDQVSLISPAKESFPCKECGKYFSSRQGLKTHVRQVHELGKYISGSFACDACERCFNSQEAMRMHSLNAHGKSIDPTNKRQRTHHGENSYECDICGSTDKDHVVSFGKNEEQQLFPCLSCDKQFKSERALLQHTNVSHS